ncbi:hypothetical protein TVAG_385470 [Trichomonas vaginalis G3]|uniref:Uncharacterized protein n=1 Tax=Trichomonas vaginalis (strain ATCC PRA-98 / G3) TaxID=412133 RepID=A2GBX0_TRIV3|nr:hypothetical protein TVAGG3_0911820 [Trichomonas vaginalis G3]EAX85348.1 hypothetical protein TVAG_385470 [Trichomonas vaginalis G3]KAI5484481.1 hypothetical protein TVAGG3_0911820 [Trichomonas vaginalis G3]|eukprot:XP_001298278.1 hypothetical protein [Trichomonas vaginalis G3]
MNENIIVYEDLKIKSIKDIVIPKPFEVLVSVEDHFYNLCQENFGETTKFFEQFIREGPGETHYDNFQYLFQFFNNNPLVEPKSDNLYFQLLQTLVEIFKPTLRTQYNTDYKIACKADLNSLFQEEKDGFDSSDSEESGFSDELTQIIRNDDVSKFQQFLSQIRTLFHCSPQSI